MFQLTINNSCKCIMRNVKRVVIRARTNSNHSNSAKMEQHRWIPYFGYFGCFLSRIIIRRCNLINANHKNKLHFMSLSFCGSCFSTSCLASFHLFDLTSTFDALKGFFSALDSFILASHSPFTVEL